ncbi:hypothetical protein [Leifsonia poae]|uniref:Uncharacterized protein n=1 Tax=Leifsonia poae TaxID=110933 RepID=A0A9W6LYP8_9MICO|nr:hypothetical protein [Leifsonia poae]GLJ75060.1 hypothetical protein GCM10017584_06330 [Leifsonia poae]
MSNPTSLRPRDIVDFSFETPDGWYDVVLLGEEGAEEWPTALAAELGGGDLAPGVVEQLTVLQQVLYGQDASGGTRARVYLPVPEAGVLSAYQTFELLELEADDSPESFLAATDAQAGHREPGYEVRGYQSWRSAHPAGELVGFTHLTALAEPDADDAVLEQRVVFVIFPVGAAQAFQMEFRSAFIGGFDDMVAETQAIADSLVVTLGDAR